MMKHVSEKTHVTENLSQPTGPGKAHPVHQMQQKLRATFSGKKNFQGAANNDCVAAINRFFKLIGWTGGQRRIFESMPHADSITSVASFRSVLFRLGFSSTVEPASRENLRNEYLPCFIRFSDGRVNLAEETGELDSVRLFDPVTGETVERKINSLNALAIFPEQIESPQITPGMTTPWSRGALKAFRPVIVQIFLISFAVNLLALAPPVYVMSVYDKAVGAKSTDVLMGLTIGIGLIIAADFILRQVRVRLQAYLGARLDEQLNETAFRHLLHLALAHTEDAPIGSQLTRLRQMTSLSEAFTGPLAGALFDLPFIVLFLAVIAIIGGPLVWVPISLIALYAVIASYAIPKTNELIRKAGDKRAQLNNLTVEAVSAQMAIHDLGAEHIWLKRQRSLSAEASYANMKSRQLNFIVQTFSQSMVAVAGAAVLAIGTSQVIEGTLSAGALIAVMALSWRVLGPIRSMFLSGLTLGQTLQSIQQVDRLVQIPLEREPNTGPTIPRTFKGRIVFDKVTFRYPSQKEPSLRGVSFDVNPGQILCLYGQSGSGTSTALRVLLGLHQQQAGSIFVDGLDLRQLDKGEWRHAIGVGLSTPDLFHGTVAQNIRLARPDATCEEVMDVATKLGIDKYFGTALDEGIDTRCTAMALSTWPDALLSQISLARAFIKDAPIYLLDEPAATLDVYGERALLSILEEKRRKSAVIMTTQRPSHMRLADIVVWMDRGIVREVGSPEQIVPKIIAA